tara:strand:- start:237 stop:500 length:264 start_codon:yes stop_codon:yes gene_type:complete
MESVSQHPANVRKKSGVTQVFNATGGGAMFWNKTFAGSLVKQVNSICREQACTTVVFERIITEVRVDLKLVNHIRGFFKRLITIYDN